jgi:HlyD family secretion protein
LDVLVEEGMKVEAGQVLAHLDDSNVKESLHLAEAQLESSRRAMDETKPKSDVCQAGAKTVRRSGGQQGDQ